MLKSGSINPRDLALKDAGAAVVAVGGVAGEGGGAALPRMRFWRLANSWAGWTFRFLDSGDSERRRGLLVVEVVPREGSRSEMILQYFGRKEKYTNRKEKYT